MPDQTRPEGPGSEEAAPREPGPERPRRWRFRLDIERSRAQIGGVETALYLVVGLMLGVAGVLILLDTAKSVFEGLTADRTLAGTGLLVLDRILLLLIIAELLYTLQLVIARGEIATEPFLFIGIIAVIRRVVVITAEVEKLPLGGRALTNFLLELAVLAVLALAFGIVVYLLRRGAAAERAVSMGTEPSAAPSAPVR